MDESKKPMLEKKKVKTLTETYNDFFKIGERVPKLLSNEKLEEFVKESKENAKKIYKALAENVFTWRYSGGIVAELKGVGDYQDYYCSGGEGAIESRKVWKLLKKSDLNVLGEGINYTWNYILNKTILKIRWKRSCKIMDLVLKIDKTINKKEKEKILEKFHRLQKKTKRRIDKWDKKEKKLKEVN